MSELAAFLASMPYNRTLLDCTPEDLLVFMQMIYIPRHAGSVLPNGSCIAAPSSVANAVSHLRMIFKELGRGKYWDDQNSAGNPAASHQLSQWNQGHEKLSYAEGFRITGAVEMTESKMVQLLTHLSQLTFHAPESSAADRALAARDAFAFCLLWQTGMRGTNAREITLQDFMLPNKGRGSVAACLISSLHSQLQHPGTIHVQPLRTKTHAHNTCMIIIPAADNPVLDTWYWMAAAYAMAALNNQPMHHYMVRSSTRKAAKQVQDSHQHMGTAHYEDQPLSRSGLYERLKLHLRSIDAYAKESMHSFRRGMAQHRAAQGHTHEAIMDNMLLQTRSILQTVYLPPGRKESGVKRLRSSAS